MNRLKILSISVDTGEYASFVNRIIALGRERIPSYVCIANVHMAIEAHDDPAFAEIVDSADLVTPDGMPLVAALRILYGIRQDRVPGMDLVGDILEAAEKESLSVFFYGSEDRVLDRIGERIRKEYPNLAIAGMHSPPFRELTNVEREDEVDRINRSGANILLVALGCPKQERWMAENRGRIRAAMVGLGAAFPVFAGTQKKAPEWMRRTSLEWLYRLTREPGRLWKRYLYTNTKFIYLLGRQFITPLFPYRQ
jgi:N-acetylglucosaminyldiphosphoundecaprenol N-acetyl-beta-D-mannosaminyltransferase